MSRSPLQIRHPDGVTITPERIARYRERMEIVEASGLEASKFESIHWWTLWEVYRDKDYLVDHRSLGDWLGWLKVQSFGSSEQTFHDTMNLIRICLSSSLTPEQVFLVLGSRAETALKVDIAKGWFDKRNGKFVPKPHIVRQLGNETVGQAIVRIAGLGAPEARRAVRDEQPDHDNIYFKDYTLDPKDGTLMVNVVWENNQGYIGTWTLNVEGFAADETAQKWLKRRGRDEARAFTPEQIVQVILSAFRLRRKD